MGPRTWSRSSPRRTAAPRSRKAPGKYDVKTDEAGAASAKREFSSTSVPTERSTRVRPCGSALIRNASPSAWRIGRALAPERTLPGAARRATAIGAASPTGRRWRSFGASARRFLRAISRRAPGRDSLRQRHRACASWARRHACRHPLRAHLGRLFADVVGFRQAAPYPRDADARPRLRGATARAFSRAIAACAPADAEIVRRRARARPPQGHRLRRSLRRVEATPAKSTPPMRAPRPTRSRNSSSPPARPACPRA